MKQSQLFTKTSKKAPKDEPSVNAQLLERGGFIQKVMAGVYNFLPLGLRVLAKIEQIIREEMDAIGGQEILMPALQPKENWEKTKRWETLDVLFKVMSRYEKQYALGPTHEEIVVPMARQFLFSYEDLPFGVYQIQTKFRDEPRAKSGLLRTREFRMKDLYSFHISEADFEKYYETVVQAYHKIFQRIGLKAIFIEASGGTFSKFSHEFQVPIQTGEDTIYVCQKCQTGKNQEIFTPDCRCTNCGKTKWQKLKASEVGNIFPLKTKFSAPFDLAFSPPEGAKEHVIMGCYGIGSSRVMGTAVEVFHDEKGILWPEAVAPFRVHLLALQAADSQKVREGADKLYKSLQEAKIEVLFDDRDASPGEKFADADLIGIPYRVVISEKTVKEKLIELRKRNEKHTVLLSVEELMSKIKTK